MAKAYYSTVLDHSADAVWFVIRMFDHYSWAGVKAETVIEDGRKGDQVGSVRRITYDGTVRRQMLLAHSDVDRSYTYAILGEPPVPMQRFQATIRVTPVIETDKAFVEWWATFDCAAEDRARIIEFFEQKGFAVWLGELRCFMQSKPRQRAAG